MSPGLGLGLSPVFGRRGGLSQYKSSMAFWSGDIDSDNRLWLDQSGNDNHASLVETACVLFVNDVTITLTTPATGASVVAVNESADNVGGVSVSSGNIVIDVSELIVTDNKIWSIELSDGQLFILQSVSSPYIWSASTMGTIGGTQDTDWSHSTSDNAYPYHLVNGFSKLPISLSGWKVSHDNRDLSYQRGMMVETEWEGVLFSSSGGLFEFMTPLNLAGAGTTYNLVCFVNRTTGIIYFGSRDVVRFSVSVGINIPEKIKIKIVLTGDSVESSDNWQVYYNDTLVPTKTASAHTFDRAFITWAGNGSGNPVIAVKNYSIKTNNRINYIIYNGRPFSGLVITEPTDYIYIPSFDNISDAVSLSLTNIAISQTHNKAETKIKLPEVATLIAADPKEFLFTAGSSNVINLSEMYSSYDNKVHCDNSKINYIKNFIVTTEAIDLSSFINGYYPLPLLSSIRNDVGGEDDSQVSHLSQLMRETGAKATIHTTLLGFNATENDWMALMLQNRMAVAIHDFAPAFWQYGDYVEGKLAYDNATPTEITNGVVTENQGLISNDYGGYTTSKAKIEWLYGATGLAYPDDTPPQDTDGNSMWWEYVIDAATILIGQYNGVISGFSPVGALPSGYNQYHPIVKKLLYEKIYTNSFKNYGEYIAYEDSFEDDVNDFTGDGLSIVTDGSSKCLKIAGVGGTAYASLLVDGIGKMGDIELELWVKSTSGAYAPFDMMGFYNKSNTHSIAFTTSVFVYGKNEGINPCIIDTWYKIILTSGSFGRKEIRIYNEALNLVFISRTSVGDQRFDDKFIIYNTNIDTLIKGVKVSGRPTSPLSFNNNSWEDYKIGDTYAEHLAKKKRAAAHIMYLRPFNINQYYGHRVYDVETKAADGTVDGIYDRSYIGFKELHDWLNQYNVQDVNSYDAGNYVPISKRCNLIPNSSLSDELLGLSGEIWGLSNLDIDNVETLKYGDNIGLLTNGKSQLISHFYFRPGFKILRMYMKGNIRLDGDEFYYYGGVVDTSGAWVFVEIPFYINSNYSIVNNLYITALADTYIQKIEIDDLL